MHTGAERVLPGGEGGAKCLFSGTKCPLSCSCAALS